MADAVMAAQEAVEGTAAGSKGLKVGALSMMAIVVIGVASTAPAYSLAASLGLAVMLLAFVPSDCGTTFTE